MGEHDLLSKDEAQLDANVAHAEQHEQYDEDLDVHDIGMIYLEDDVEFTGSNRRVLRLNRDVF